MTSQQQLNVNNFIYGLELWEAWKVFNMSELSRQELIINAIERYWPDDLKLIDFVQSLTTGISEIKERRWLRTALISHTECYLARNPQIKQKNSVEKLVDIACGF